MDWVVPVSASESAAGELRPETDSAARAALDEHGCVLLRGALPTATVEAMYGEYVAQLGKLDLAGMEAEAMKPPPNRLIGVGPARFDITLRMSGAFGRTDVFANGVLVNLLRQLLGRDMRLNSFTTVVSYPGSPRQQAHRDHIHLFPQPGVAPNLPIYAVNAAVPLVDVDLETGPTGVWLGSHRSALAISVQDSAMVAVPLQRGDCMLLDYRTVHAGMPNKSQRARPILYMVYGRRWFFDDINYVNRIPLDMPLEHYHTMPESVRPLLVRAFSIAMLTRAHEAPARPRADVEPPPAAARPPEPLRAGKTGRNDPCPCGSGKKYQQCHGRLP
jgi:hypothetical protein